MRRTGRVAVLRILWSIHVAVAASGLLLLAQALFVRPAPGVIPEPPELPGREDSHDSFPVDSDVERLAQAKMTRRIHRPKVDLKTSQAAIPIASLVRLTGIMDFGTPDTALAFFELSQVGQTKGYKMGDRIGGTSALVREIGEDAVVVEYERHRYRVTFRGAEELPWNPIGDALPTLDGKRR